MTKKQKRIVACGCLGAATIAMSALFMTKDMWGNALFGQKADVQLADTKLNRASLEEGKAPTKVKATKEKKVITDGMTIHFQWESEDGGVSSFILRQCKWKEKDEHDKSWCANEQGVR